MAISIFVNIAYIWFCSGVLHCPVADSNYSKLITTIIFYNEDGSWFLLRLLFNLYHIRYSFVAIVSPNLDFYLKHSLQKPGQALRVPKFQNSRYMRVTSPAYRSPLPHRKYSWYSFLLEALCGRKECVYETLL
jgi:hypothetical protein